MKADLNTVTAAAAAAAEDIPDDFRVSITNPAGKDAYPIASFTWLLVPDKSNARSKQPADQVRKPAVNMRDGGQAPAPAGMGRRP